MSKNKTHKRTRHLQGQIKALESELKRLKKSKNLDKDEIEYDLNGNNVDEELTPCTFCDIGFMAVINIADREYYKCSSCHRTKRKKNENNKS